MHPLSARDVLNFWERAESQNSVNRALTLLGVACPEMTREEIAELSIGRRNGLLMTLWELTFGPHLHGYGECPECCKRLEFTVNVPDLHSANAVEPSKSELALTAEGFEAQFRLPNSVDLVEVADCNDVDAARSILVRRCVLRTRQGDTEIAAEELAEPVIAELANYILENDPLSEVQLDLHCPECGNCWASFLDIVSFFWAEISAQAKHLLHEIHSLARAYGWREADILAMSARRRQLYLEMVT